MKQSIRWFRLLSCFLLIGMSCLTGQIEHKGKASDADIAQIEKKISGFVDEKVRHNVATTIAGKGGIYQKKWTDKLYTAAGDPRLLPNHRKATIRNNTPGNVKGVWAPTLLTTSAIELIVKNLSDENPIVVLPRTVYWEIYNSIIQKLDISDLYALEEESVERIKKAWRDSGRNMDYLKLPPHDGISCSIM